MRWGWLALVFLLGACGGGSDANPTPVLVSITQGVETCGDVIRAAAQHPYCDGRDLICYAVATYNPASPTENVVERGIIGPLERVRDTSRQMGRPADITNGVRWTSAAVYTQNTVLTTLGATTLAGLSAELDNLTLTTDTVVTDCDDAPAPGLLVQTQRNEIVLMINGARITVTQTTLIRERDGALLIYALEGVTVVSSDGVTRIVRTGEQTSLSTTGNSLEAPRPATPYDPLLLAGLPLAGLPQLILPRPSAVPPQTATACSVRADWTGEYTVERGDTLVTIAPRFGLEPDDLRVGNCVQNPNRLRVGTTLRVPVTATATAAAPLLLRGHLKISSECV